MKLVFQRSELNFCFMTGNKNQDLITSAKLVTDILNHI